MIEIKFAHEDFFIVDKPAGLSFHSEDCTGVMAILEHQLQMKLHSIHRLDKETSGLLVFAKNKEACRKLSSLWQNKLVDKFYLAISDLRPKKKQGLIKGDMVTTRGGNYKLSRSNKNPAITHFISHSIRPGRRLYLCKPITGKTHQIRVALKSIGAPILGDTRYSKTTSDRMYLHCYGLKFNYKGNLIQVLCPPNYGNEFLGEDFLNALNVLGDPFEDTFEINQ